MTSEGPVSRDLTSIPPAVEQHLHAALDAAGGREEAYVAVLEILKDFIADDFAEDEGTNHADAWGHLKQAQACLLGIAGQKGA